MQPRVIEQYFFLLELTVAFCCNVRVFREFLLIRICKIDVEVKNEKLTIIKHAS